MWLNIMDLNKNEEQTCPALIREIKAHDVCTKFDRLPSKFVYSYSEHIRKKLRTYFLCQKTPHLQLIIPYLHLKDNFPPIHHQEVVSIEEIHSLFER